MKENSFFGKPVASRVRRMLRYVASKELFLSFQLFRFGGELKLGILKFAFL